MRSEARCIPCVIHQCQRIVQMVTDDESKLLSVTHRILDRIQELTLEDPPSIFTSYLLHDTYAALGVEDPFVEAKKQMNELGHKAAEAARARIQHTSDPLHTAILYAAAGNIIDIGPRASFDLDAALANLHFKHDDYRVLREKLHGAERVTYLLDNAGEIFFDRLLIERLAGLELTIVVKGGPILNDATMHDAEVAGLKQLGRVITTGNRFLGVNWDASSEEFKTAFESADIVIAKGHANFESAVDRERDVFFILKAKCPVVAARLNVQENDAVFYYSPVKSED
jgi:damage-control phosphatase, subfamily I